MRTRATLIVTALALTACGGPSEADLRQQGYTDCVEFREFVGVQINNPDAECIEDGQLTTFRETVYYRGR